MSNPLVSTPLLPSDACWPTTTTVGAFEVPAKRFASWLTKSLATPSERWATERRSWSGMGEFLAQLNPLERIGISKVGILGVAEWSFVLNNAALGTDLGMLPSLCARELARQALRLTCQQRDYPATILELYSPLVEDALKCRRAISAANDGGRWRFDEYGEPFPFEATDSYAAARIEDRFTPDLLHRYVSAMNVPIARLNVEAPEVYLVQCRNAA